MPLENLSVLFGAPQNENRLNPQKKLEHFVTQKYADAIRKLQFK